MVAAALGLKFGWLVGAGFLLGIYLGAKLSILMFMAVFNTACLLFLRMTREDVREYLRSWYKQ